MTAKNIFSKIRNSYCIACGATPCDVAHIRSRGAGGGDQEFNLLSLCRLHHSQQHAIGWKKFTEKHNSVMASLTLKGWEFNERNQLRRI